MKKILHYLFYFVFFFIHGCSTLKQAAAVIDNGNIEVTLIQINDVYEIAPLDNGKTGGMARVVTIKKDFLRDNSNTFLVIAGIF